MDNNDFCRRLRYALQLDDAETAKLASAGGYATDPAQAAAWRTKEEDPGFEVCPDAALQALMAGLVLDRRGPPKEGSAPPPPTKAPDNNSLLKSVKIALSLRTEDVRDCIIGGGGEVTTSEIGSLLRRPDARNFRGCGDQLLRRFLTGLAERERNTVDAHIGKGEK